MTGLVVLAVTAAIFALNILIIKSNAGVVALALMSGFVLNTYAGNELALVSSSFLRGNQVWVESIAHIVCVVLPSLLIMWFLRKTAAGSVFIVNVPLAILAGFMLILFVIPQLPDNTQTQFTSTQLWQLLRQFQIVLVCVTLLLATFQFWLMRPKFDGKHKKE